jgi:hypothetical protein
MLNALLSGSLFGIKKEDIFFYIILFCVIGVSIKIYTESDAYNLKCIMSDVDGKTYCVRERENLDKAADLLATVTSKCKTLVEFMKEKYSDREDVKRLVVGFNPEKISETLPTSKLTAYSENKGQKIAFCLNKKKDKPELIDLNTLTFVAIHELSHVMTLSIGHKKEFWDNFKFLLENAKEIGIYSPIDYKKKPQEYCGMTITDNPFYDV